MHVIDVSALFSACFPLALVVRGDVLRGWFETLDFWVSVISLWLRLGIFVWKIWTGVSSLFGILFLGVSKVQLISIPSQGLGMLVEITFNHIVGLVVFQRRSKLGKKLRHGGYVENAVCQCVDLAQLVLSKVGFFKVEEELLFCHVDLFDKVQFPELL